MITLASRNGRINHVFAFLALYMTSTGDAFALLSTQPNASYKITKHPLNSLVSMRRTHPSPRLFQRSPNDTDDDNDEEGDDEETSLESVEHARQRFEDLMSIPQDNKAQKSSRSSSSKSLLSSSLSVDEALGETGKPIPNLSTLTRTIATLQSNLPPPPLTAILRERRLTELKLLSSLKDSDEAMNELWSLWFSERGPTAATILLRAEELVSQSSSQPQKLHEAEVILWGLIESYGLHWAEPANRLATVLYLQGRLEESKALCEAVLDEKPWHFGALSGIVMVCAGLRDVSAARLWADRRLPPLIPEQTSGSRRTAWVNQACRDANDSLSVAEKVGRDAGIGREEVEYRRMRNQLEKGVTRRDESVNDDDSWQ